MKRAIETREEMGDYIRNFSESQFNKAHTIPTDRDREMRKPAIITSLGGIGVS